MKNMKEEAGADDRPLAAVGHVTLKVTDVPRAADFYSRLGLRMVTARDSMAILELRGGTHLLLFRARGTPRRGRIRSFDLMVDDVDTLRAREPKRSRVSVVVSRSVERQSPTLSRHSKD